MVSTARRERSRPSPAETPAPVVNDPDINNQFPAGLVMQEAPYHSAAVFQIRDILTRHVAWLGIPDPIIASNLLVLFDSAGRTVRLVPDIFVAFGVVEDPKLSFRVPRGSDLRMFVLEVSSLSTHESDQTTKMLSYAEMGAQEYWLFDPTGELQVPRLQGFRLADGEYVRIPGDGESEDHAVHSEVLRTDLYLEGRALRLASPAIVPDVPTLSELQEFWDKHKRDRRIQERLPLDEQSGDQAVELRTPNRKVVHPSSSEDGS